MSYDMMYKYKGFTISIVRNSLPKINEWYCGYVLVENKNIKCEGFGNETFRESSKDGTILGIDTNHWHNNKMDMHDKLKDCKEQIESLIDDYIDRELNEGKE